MKRKADFTVQETVTGVIPMVTSDKQYSFLDLFLITSGFAIATWCYTQGAYVAQYLTFTQMFINILCFNLVFVFIECIPILFAVRYGIDLWIYLRSVLGQKGVAILAALISMMNFGWYAVGANLFSSSMINLASAFGLSLDKNIWNPLLGLFCVITGSLIALAGSGVIKWVNRLLVGALLAVGIAVIIICFTAVPLRNLLEIKPVLPEGMSRLEAFMISSEGNAAFAFGWSTQALVLPRLAKTERAGYWGTVLPCGIIAPLFTFAGAVMALAMFSKTGIYEDDPTNMLFTLSGAKTALLSLLLVAFANIGTQGTGSYVNCMIIKSGMPKVSYKLLVILAMIYVGTLTVWGGVSEHFGAFISITAFIQSPIVGITVVDYLVVKRRKLSLKSAYFMNGHDAYRFTHGFNLVGLSCVFISCFITALFVYTPLTGEIKSKLFYIFTGSGFAAILGGALYWFMSLTPLRSYMLKDRDDLHII